jgi:hypothetical protein
MTPLNSLISTIILASLLLGSGWCVHANQGGALTDGPAFALTAFMAEAPIETPSTYEPEFEGDSPFRTLKTVKSGEVHDDTGRILTRLYVLLCTYRI